MPLLGAVLDLAIPPTALTASMDEQLRKESRESLLIALLRLWVQRNPAPLLLVLDDAHWFDPLSRDLLGALGRALPNLPVAILVAYRLPIGTGVPALPVTTLPHFTEVPLRELAPADATQLATARLTRRWSASDVTASLVTALLARAQGNPFYLEELANYLVEQLVDPADPAALAHIEWPTSLHSLVLSRIDQLTEHQQRALKVASIIGWLFPVAWLEGYYPTLNTPAQLRTDLNIMAHQELTVLDSPEPALAYLFKHIVTQEVAYQSLAQVTRQMLHGQLAAWLERNAGQNLDLLAFHYARSAEDAKAREYLRQAGDAAIAAYNHAAARDYYEQVLARLPPGDRDEGALRVALGNVLDQAGAWEEALVQYQAAQVVAAAHADGRTVAQALLGLGVVHTRRADYPAASRQLDAARAAFAQIGTTTELRQVEAELGWVYALQGDNRQARAVLELALDQASGATRALILKNLANVAWRHGDLQTARAQSEESLALYRTLDDRPGLARALTTLGTLDHLQGNYVQARAIHEESLAIHQELGNRAGSSSALNSLGIVAYYEGQYDDALACFEESLALARELGDRLGVAKALINLASVVEEQGEYATAQAWYEQSLTLLQELGDQWGIAITVGNLGEVAYYQGEDGRAEALLRESLALRRILDDRLGIATVLHFLSNLALRQGQPEAARALTDESLDLRRTLGDQAGWAAGLISLGAIAHAQGADAAARQAFAAGLRASQAIGAARESLWSMIGLAAVSLRQEQAAAAARWLAAVAAQATILGYHLDPLYQELAVATATQARAVLGEEAYTTAQAAGTIQPWTTIQAEALANDPPAPLAA